MSSVHRVVQDLRPIAAHIPGVLAGDADARDAFVAATAPTVLGWCERLGGPHIDAEDAAHDALERALSRLHVLRDPDAFAPWLYQLTRRVVLDHRRRAWLRRWVPGFVIDPPDPREGAPDALARSETVAAVRTILDDLPVELREVLVLCEIEERGGAEVAELVGVPLGTVKSRLRRARARFEKGARRSGLAPIPHEQRVETHETSSEAEADGGVSPTQPPRRPVAGGDR